MKVTRIISKLDNFGEARAKEIRSGSIIFHVRGNLDSISEVENLVQYIDNKPSAEMTITGKYSDALIIVKINCEKFDSLPPYLTD